jgi:hypothetical protein
MEDASRESSFIAIDLGRFSRNMVFMKSFLLANGVDIVNMMFDRGAKSS